MNRAPPNVNPVRRLRGGRSKGALVARSGRGASRSDERWGSDRLVPRRLSRVIAGPGSQPQHHLDAEKRRPRRLGCSMQDAWRKPPAGPPLSCCPAPRPRVPRARRRRSGGRPPSTNPGTRRRRGGRGRPQTRQTPLTDAFRGTSSAASAQGRSVVTCWATVIWCRSAGPAGARSPQRRRGGAGLVIGCNVTMDGTPCSSGRGRRAPVQRPPDPQMPAPTRASRGNLEHLARRARGN